MNMRSKLIVWGVLIGLDFAYLGLIFESKGMKRFGTTLFLIAVAILASMGMRKLGVKPHSIFKGTVRSAKNTAVLGRQHIKLSKRLVLISTIVLIVGTLILSMVVIFPPRAVPLEMERRYPLAPIVSDLGASLELMIPPEIVVPSPQDVASRAFSWIKKNIAQFGSIEQDYIAAIREAEFSFNLTALYKSIFGNKSELIEDFIGSTSMMTIDAPAERIRTLFSGFNLSDFQPNEVGLAIIIPKWAFLRPAVNELINALLDLPPHSELAIPIVTQSEGFGNKSNTEWLNVSIAKVIRTMIGPRGFVERGFMLPSTLSDVVLLSDLDTALSDLEFLLYIPWNNTSALKSFFEKPIFSEGNPLLFRYFYNIRLDTPPDLLERNTYDLKFLQSLQRVIMGERQQSDSLRYYPNLTSPYLEYVSADDVALLKIELWIEALLLGIPLLILSFYLVDFANNLLSKRKRRVIRLLRVRGGSEWHVLVVLLLELLIAGIVSGIFALVIVIPLVESSLNVNNLFGFSFSLGSKNYLCYASSLRLIFLGSVLLNLHLNSSALARFVQATIIELEEPWEDAPSLVQKLNLDVIAAAAGVISGAILYFHLFSRLPGIFAFFLTIIILLGFYGLTFGTVSLLFRWFPKIIVFFSVLIDNTFDHLVVLALRNLNLRKITAARVVSLLIVGLIIANFFAILGSSVNQTYYTQSMYLHGGEVSIQFSDNAVPPEFLVDFSRIKGLEAWTNVTVLEFMNSAFVYAEQSFLLINLTSFFSVVNIPDTDIVALQEESVKEALRKPNSVIISNYEHEEFAYDLGDNISLSFTLSPDQYPPWVNQSLPLAKYSQTFTVRGIYKYWPIAGVAAYTMFDYTHYVRYNARIADVSTFPDLAYFAQQALNRNFSNSEMEIKAYSYVFGNLASGADPDAVLEEIKALLAKYQLTFAEPFVIYSEGNSATTPLVWAMLSLNIVASFVVAGLAIVLFSFITWSDRKQEAGLLKSLGMTRGQLSAMFVLETLVLLVFGVLLGLLISLFLAFSYLPRFLSLVISGIDLADTTLPLTIAIPWEPILLGILAIVLAGLVASIIVGSLFSRQPAGDILRVE